uniref:Fe2OG dioxygenase domain-containing protein n=1 Tax=Leersia perrieri TaxID=77586 RepID=A0A0D9WNY7_9ORYZ
MASSAAATDRAALVKEFDETHAGVRGLVESGVSAVPEIFRHPDPYASIPFAPHGVSIPGKSMICHYYPVCPEPERTMGIVPHTDPGVLTVLAQDAVGGLQVKHTAEDGGSYWVDAKPVPGALLINVGDLLQIMSNDRYKSVEHRVIMNSHEEARVSGVVFFTPGKRGALDFYGPLPGLISSENPPKYRSFTMSEFLGAFFKQDLASKAIIEHFKI